MPRRFPESNRIEFESLNWEVLVEVGQNRLKERRFTLLGEAETAKAFENVMRYEADKDPPENAGGAINAVDAMITEHDAGEDSNDDCYITAVDIHAACPKAAAAAAATATAPAAAPASTAGGARCSSASGSQGSSSAAAAGPAVASDSEEDQPFGKRQCKAAAPAPAPSASSRKRKAESEEVGARDLSPEAKTMVKAIDALYKLDEEASPIVAWDLLKKLHELRQFENGSSVHEKMEQSKALGKKLKDWLKEGIGHISARGGKSKNVRHEVTSRDNKLMVYGLSPKN